MSKISSKAGGAVRGCVSSVTPRDEETSGKWNDCCLVDGAADDACCCINKAGDDGVEELQLDVLELESGPCKNAK